MSVGRTRATMEAFWQGHSTEVVAEYAAGLPDHRSADLEPFESTSIMSLPFSFPEAIVSRAQYDVGTYLAAYPSLCFPLMRLSRKRRARLVDERTEIVIEGFPRSGNTFAVVAFRVAQQRPLAIAHHLHVPAQVIWAVRKGVPALLLIRKPTDAVISLVIYDPTVSIARALKRYIRFYTAVAPHSDGCIVATFDQVISSFGDVTERINARYQTSFLTFDHTEEDVQRCFEIIEQKHRRRRRRPSVTEATVSRPSPEREKLKELLRKDLQEPRIRPLIARANEQYDELASSL